jgi:recombinational DNA repair protein (RecF pathway)
MHEQDNAMPAKAPSPSRQCSRCGATKPVKAFYSNPSTVCKDCHNKASRFTGVCRRAAIARLVSTHIAEYRALLAAERERRQHGRHTMPGGGSDVA